MSYGCLETKTEYSRLTILHGQQEAGLWRVWVAGRWWPLQLTHPFLTPKTHPCHMEPVTSLCSCQLAGFTRSLKLTDSNAKKNRRKEGGRGGNYQISFLSAFDLFILGRSANCEYNTVYSWRIFVVFYKRLKVTPSPPPPPPEPLILPLVS